ncbi:MAG: crossover junction endodeoxyribonuclease RuvC [Pirellulaceae bacterium]|jgi:crossover junction endodeoxyribonuclease RuvC
MNELKSDATIILGIDPGLITTGYGILKQSGGKLELLEAGVIRSNAKDELEQRLQSLFVGAVEIVESFRPDVMAIEELYSHYERPSTAILMGHARGVLCLAAAQHNVPIRHYRATQIKSVMTGNGRAPKSQVQLAVMNHLHLASVPDPPDVADALAIGICHYFQSRNEILRR